MDVREYLTADGKNPYREWLDTLDATPRARIQARVLRFSTGNLGDHKSVGGGVCHRVRYRLNDRNDDHRQRDEHRPEAHPRHARSGPGGT